VEPLTNGAGLSGAVLARAAGPLGPGRRGGEERAWRGLGQNWPSRGGEGFSFFFFYFLFHFSIFYFVSFYFLFFWTNNLLTNLECWK
jgi:hypothetical protein